MRINVYVARSTGVSRRRADELIASGRVSIDGRTANLGDEVDTSSNIRLDDKRLLQPEGSTTVLLNKPKGYVVSRRGQGAKTIYQLLPEKYRALKPIGRLDKDSTGLLILTSDGRLSQRLAHPGAKVSKVYLVSLDKPLNSRDRSKIEAGVLLQDGQSRLKLSGASIDHKTWTVLMHEGRKRQIRRTFAMLGYGVETLHRTSIGNFELGALKTGAYKRLDD